MFTTARRHGLPLPSPTAKHDRERQKHEQQQEYQHTEQQQQKRKDKNKQPALSAPPTPSNQTHAQAYAAARPATATAGPASFSRATGRPLAHPHASAAHPRPLTAIGTVGGATATHLPPSVPQTFPTPAPSPLLSPLSAQAPLRLAMPRASASACATPSPLSSGLPSPTLPPLPSSHLASQPQQTPAQTQSIPHVRSPVINIVSGPNGGSPLVHHARKLSKDEFDYRVGGGIIVRPTHIRKFSVSSESGSVSVASPSSPLSPASGGSSSSMHEDVFSPGDRVGAGLMLQGEVLQRVFSENDGARSDKEEPAAELEVVRRLGAGSYAIVYLVREVLHHPPADVLDGLDYTDRRRPECDKIDELEFWDSSDMDLDSDPLELDGMCRKKENEDDCEKVYYGKEYAVKVLSKAGMDEEALEAQLVEANIHQSLPIHPNIVTLHRALETPSFLLLVLEFVPGEDLYYFLEQARDHHEPEPLSSASASSESDGDGEGQEDRRHKANVSVLSVNSVNTVATMNTTRTPPTPSLLSTLNEKQLLGRRRLRLIASMFSQMCEAVAVCHDVGVYHRDIKPENFIVTDGWEEDGERRRVVVKLTDFGLSTRDAASSDMDCGSAPYMSYECRNNCAPTYAPRAADVWSLGIVLINMLYHINPWTDTTQGVCPSFSAFLAAPEHFFMQRFAGMVPAVASFLCQRIFCILPSEDPADSAGRRVSAREFGRWAKELPRMMGREEPVGVPPALAMAATAAEKSISVSSLAFPAQDNEKQQQQQRTEKEKESEILPLASPTSPSSTLLAQSLAAVLAQQEAAAAAAGSSSPAWRHKRGLSNASVGYALSSVPQSRRPASRQQSFSAERSGIPALQHLGLSTLSGIGSAAGSRAATPLLRGRALGSVGPGTRSRVPSSCETPAQMGVVAELPTVFDEGEGDMSSGSLGLELGRDDERRMEEEEQLHYISDIKEDERERYREVEQYHELEQEREQEQEHEHEQEQDGEDGSSMSRSTSMVRRRKRGARRGKGQIIQQQQMEIARLQQQQEELARQVQIMQEQLQKQQQQAQTQAQVQVLSSLNPVLSTATSAKSLAQSHHSQTLPVVGPQSQTGTGDALDSLASKSEALARELSRTRNARGGAPSQHSHSHLHSPLSSHTHTSQLSAAVAAANQNANLHIGGAAPTGSGNLSNSGSTSNNSSGNFPSVSVSAPVSLPVPMRAISSTSLGTRESSPSPSLQVPGQVSTTMQASPAAALALAGAGGPTPGAIFPVSFASPGRSSSAGSATRRSQNSASTSAKNSMSDAQAGNAPTSTTSTPAPVQAPVIAKKTSKWKLSFGKGSSNAHSRAPLPQVQVQVQQAPAQPETRSEVIDISVENNNGNAHENGGYNEEDGSADARQSTSTEAGSTQHGMGGGAGKAPGSSTSANASNEPWARGRRPAGATGSQHPWNASTTSTDRWPNAERERNVSPNSTRTGRSGNLSTLSSSASSLSHTSSSSNNWRHSTLTTSSAASGWTRYSNSSMRSVSTVATSVSGGSGSWRNGNASNASLASAERKPGHYHGQASIASRKSDKSSLSGMPPPNVKIMTGVPWALDELPRQLHPNPSGDIFGMPPTARKQRVRKPKDLPTISERPGHGSSSSGFNTSKAPAGKSPLSQRADAGRSSTSLPRNSGEGDERESEERERADGTPRKVQKGQINALAKMLSALRR